MKLFRFLATVLPAISLKFDKSGKLCWIICGFYLYLHLFFYKIRQINTLPGFYCLSNEHRYEINI
jgi:hypothetical protein